MPGLTPASRAEPPSLRDPAAGWWSRDVNRTVGGGMAAIELLRRSLTRRAGSTSGEHGVLVAVSRFTPGTNVLAYCAALGWTRAPRRRRDASAVAGGSLRARPS